MGRATQPRGIVGALVNDWSVATFMTVQSGVPVAVTQANSLGYAGFTTSDRISSAIPRCPWTSVPTNAGSIPRRSP